jgi:hypothetical protein
MTVNKRKRYIVIVEGNGVTEHAVIVTKDLEGMYKEIYRLYGHLLKDINGKDVGKITFEESTLA